MQTSTLQALRTPALRDLFWFLLVGGSVAMSFVVLSALMIELNTGLPDWLMSALCWAALVGPAYLMHRAVSFRSGPPHTRALPRYVLVQVVGVTLAARFSYLAYAILGVSSLVGAVMVAALTAGLNFAILKLWAFAAH